MDLLDLPRMFAGLLMLSLALWCYALDPRSRVLRAFALFLTLRGMLNLVLPMGSETPGSDLDVWTAYAPYYQIAVPFAAAAFAVRLLHDGPRPKTMGALLGAAVGLELLYAWDHSLFWGRGGTGGVLRAAIAVGTLTYLGIAHILLRRDGRAHRVTAVSFTLFPVFAAVFDVFHLAYASGSDPERLLESGMYYGLRVVALAYAAYLGVWMARRRLLGGLAAMAGAASAGVAPHLLAPAFPGSTLLELAAPFNGLLTIAMPLAVAWALTERAVFGHQAALRLRGGHIVGLLATVWVMFLVALGAAWVGAPEVGAVVGVVAAAVLLFLVGQSWELGTPSKEALSRTQLLSP